MHLVEYLLLVVLDTAPTSQGHHLVKWCTKLVGVTVSENIKYILLVVTYTVNFRYSKL